MLQYIASLVPPYFPTSQVSLSLHYRIPPIYISISQNKQKNICLVYFRCWEMCCFFMPTFRARTLVLSQFSHFLLPFPYCMIQQYLSFFYSYSTPTSHNCLPATPLSQHCFPNNGVHYRIYYRKCVSDPSNKAPRKIILRTGTILVGKAIMFAVGRSCTMVNLFVG